MQAKLVPFATAAFEAVNLNSFPSFFSLLQALKHISIVYGSMVTLTALLIN